MKFTKIQMYDSFFYITTEETKFDLIRILQRNQFKFFLNNTDYTDFEQEKKTIFQKTKPK